MKNIKFAVLFLLFTITPMLAITNSESNTIFGISISYEANSFFESGDIVIKSGPLNSFTLYDSYQERKVAAKIIALQKETHQYEQDIAATEEKKDKVDQSTYDLLQKQLLNLTINSKYREI